MEIDAQGAAQEKKDKEGLITKSPNEKRLIPDGKPPEVEEYFAQDAENYADFASLTDEEVAMELLGQRVKVWSWKPRIISIDNFIDKVLQLF